MMPRAPLLPQSHRDTKGCGHRQCEAESCHQWYPDGAEDEHQQQEGQDQHDADVGQQHVGKPLRDVLVDGRNTGDGVAGARVLVVLVLCIADGLQKVSLSRYPYLRLVVSKR